MKVKEVEIAKEVMAGDVLPVAMFLSGTIFEMSAAIVMFMVSSPSHVSASVGP